MSNFVFTGIFCIHDRKIYIKNVKMKMVAKLEWDVLGHLITRNCHYNKVANRWFPCTYFGP